MRDVMSISVWSCIMQILIKTVYFLYCIFIGLLYWLTNVGWRLMQLKFSNFISKFSSFTLKSNSSLGPLILCFNYVRFSLLINELWLMIEFRNYILRALFLRSLFIKFSLFFCRFYFFLCFILLRYVFKWFLTSVTFGSCVNPLLQKFSICNLQFISGKRL